jgi:putative restriction endonuclease
LLFKVVDCGVSMGRISPTCMVSSLVSSSGCNSRAAKVTSVAITARTSEQIAQVFARRGEDAFSVNVRRNYGGRCCFPGCGVADERFLVGAHSTRWCDARELLGKNANGLCLCLFYDRACEDGLLTLTTKFQVDASMTKVQYGLWAKDNIAPCHGRAIRLGPAVPELASLRRH